MDSVYNRLKFIYDKYKGEIKCDSEPKIKKDTINEGNINLYTKI